ncbi:unnamed protein product [Wuchereria bancrofti]|uniref:RNA polymerase II subunit A C-terminal domain phosphatase SSU72 n=2 Tax=Wuchereria bancrofti TaxID=6293 RepID=A0A3P7GKE0_WUCBA|nr:unnamed protein product [Wuchereria bancrofti]
MGKLRFAVSCSSNMNRSMEAHSFLQYTQNGLLNMLDRNRRIKDMPQKFQHFSGKFDVIICLEERVYDQIVEDLQTRDTNEGDSVHVINIDIQDNHEEATIGALFVYDLCLRFKI